MTSSPKMLTVVPPVMGVYVPEKAEKPYEAAVCAEAPKDSKINESSRNDFLISIDVE